VGASGSEPSWIVAKEVSEAVEAKGMDMHILILLLHLDLKLFTKWRTFRVQWKNISFSSLMSSQALDFTWTEGLPPVTRPYRPDHACDDIPHVSRALDAFLNNRMLETEEFCDTSDPDK
jgi:hypothetical protein